MNDMIKTTCNVDIPEEELSAYKDYVIKKYPDRKIDNVNITIGDDGMVDIETHFKPQPKFTRIRRITGYLVGTVDRFNNAKRAEEHDRVKHDV